MGVEDVNYPAATETAERLTWLRDFQTMKAAPHLVDATRQSPRWWTAQRFLAVEYFRICEGRAAAQVIIGKRLLRK
jgi:hypothetical protein